MQIQIQTPAEVQYLKGLVFGPWGHGKTVLLSTAQDDPRTKPVLFLDFEGGSSSIADRNDIDLISCQSWRDFNAAYDYLVNGDHDYQSVVVDSISEVHTNALLTILENEKHSRSDPDMLQIQDYGKAATQMRKFIRKFRDLPMHVLFSALVKSETDPQEGEIKIPKLAGQLASEIPGMLNLVGYLAITKDAEGVTQRVLLLKNYPKFGVKIRKPPSREIPDEIFDPAVGKILDTLGYEVESSDTSGHEVEAPDEQTIEFKEGDDI